MTKMYTKIECMGFSMSLGVDGLPFFGSKMSAAVCKYFFSETNKANDGNFLNYGEIRLLPSQKERGKKILARCRN